MKSVFWLERGVIGGRPGPQREPWSIPELRAAGFEAVINLSEYAPDFAAFRSVGMEATWVPLPTDIPPTKASEEKCVADLPRAYEFLVAQIEAGRRVLVHCYAGQDRTGMLLALYLAKKEGIPASVAIRKLREVRPSAITTLGWETLALVVIPRVIEKLVR